MSYVLNGNLEKTFQIIDYGKGIYLYDNNGKEYIDASGGAVVVNIGHGIKEITKAMITQAEKVSFVYQGQFSNEPKEALSKEIISFTSGDFSKVFYISGGSEATESALKIARQYHIETGNESKYIVISHWQSYHGNTIGALSMSGRTSWRKYYTPYLCDFPHIASPYCYRCYYEKRYPDCGLLCAYALEKTINLIGAEYISAFIAEPVTGGTVPALAPPPGYFKIIREICDRYNVLFISDEVLCGFGRTGKNFGIDHWDVKPDLMACGKGLAGGYTPIGAVIISEKIYEGFKNGSGHVMHSHTYGGNPLSCAIALSVLKYLKSNNLVQRSKEMGNYLFKKAQELSNIKIIGEIAGGKGLLLGIELVKDKKTKEPFEKKLNLSSRIVNEALEEGLVILPGSGGCVDGVNGDRIELSPPFIVTKQEIDIIIEKLKKVLLRIDTLEKI